MIVAPGVGGRERAALVVVRSRADPLLAARMRQRANGAVEAQLRERRGLSLARAEAGTPEQALGLFTPKGLPRGLRGARWAAGFLKRYRDETVFVSPPQFVQRTLIALLARDV